MFWVLFFRYFSSPFEALSFCPFLLTYGRRKKLEKRICWCAAAVYCIGVSETRNPAPSPRLPPPPNITHRRHHPWGLGGAKAKEKEKRKHSRAYGKEEEKGAAHFLVAKASLSARKINPPLSLSHGFFPLRLTRREKEPWWCRRRTAEKRANKHLTR